MNEFFKLKEHNTTVKTEVIAGITTFVTMAYILIVNPLMLSETGMNFNAVFMATCLSAAIGTLIMGLYANLPFAQAPGMGLNAFFTYSVVFGLGYSWEAALAAVFISGLFFIFLTVTGVRELIVEAIPNSLKHAIAAGIGLFIALIGFKNAGIVVPSGATLVTFGNFLEAPVLLAVIGLIITAFLMAKNIRGGLLFGIIATTLIGIPMGVTDTTMTSFSLNIGDTLFKAFNPGFRDLMGMQGGFGPVLLSISTVVISFALVDMFDTIGTLIGTGAKAGMLDEKGKLPNMNKALLADAVATSAGALLGTSTVTTYVESAAGVAEGGRTGLTAVTTGIMFILAIFIAPFALMVPGEATAPALIIVGVLMMSTIKNINFEDFEEAVPAFFTIAIMPFSFSIANGIGAGLIFYPITKLAAGKSKDVHPAVYVLALLFIAKLAFLPR
ncbi:NCS2 family permease [Serpentinicella alkaliphila]|uniref:AGZA family xanthine/uracil permease-like MFS transporter n=1 Tax=Serpentinicella alkaliphila TaxID=1734049 RepID=A0A4R2TIS7_9FIRM|nr:NCS2 family permease [Serpentinicella alkaliphila]QUH24852.1 NCS2 family permease [Serpentinicella alkaliphila]TCQ03438.1 AGZA family xanthine/uracil permease-like MFS transporter [Serpentinicella alkaliphila]